MKNTMSSQMRWLGLAVAISLGGTSFVYAQAGGSAAQKGGGAPAAAQAGATQPGAATNDSRAQVQAKVQPDIEKRRQEAERQAQSTLDQDAVQAIAETQKAIEALAANNTDEALAAIERATGKIHILTGRNPATALLPIRVVVEAIDLAPLDIKQIDTLAGEARRAVVEKDYPAARAVLQGLISEIRVRTFNLPLVSYPAAMREAARLIDQKRTEEATAILQLALNTLVVVDHVTPLPVVVAQAAVEDAQAVSQKDKDAAQKLLTVAKLELDRAKHLGYAGNDPEYVALNDEISNLEKQLKGSTDTASAFSRLKEKLASFFKRQSDKPNKAQVASL